MLNLRTGLVLTAAGLCLWALFELLSQLKEPGLLRSEKAAVIKGCDEIDNEETRKACAPLLCQKLLLDNKQVAWNVRFTLEQQASSSDPSSEIVRGSTDRGDVLACLVRGKEVSAYKVGAADDVRAFVTLADEEPDQLIEVDE